MSAHSVLAGAVVAAILAPLSALLVLVLGAAIGARPGERFVGGVARAAFGAQCLACLLAIAAFATDRPGHVVVALPSWFVAGHYEFETGLAVDAHALAFLGLVGLVSALVGSVSHRYLHREEGYRRFFVLLLAFSAGMSVIAVGESLDLVFVGWEIVGIASAMLIGFYQERVAPTRHALLAFVVYRTCDVGLLAAVVLLHGFSGHAGIPSHGAPPLPVGQATILGLLLLFGAMGKSAQMPFTGWLPRAMEGPTTSSAIFYGALSVHAGAYLLVRTAPVYQGAPVVHAAIVLVGAVTAIVSTVVGRVQTDAKTSIAYATVAQVGVIFVEIGLGFHALALAHIAGNALLRSFQILRSPSIIADHERLEDVLGGPRPRAGVHFERLLPAPARRWLYRFALERGYVDAIAANVAATARRALLALDHVDRRIVEAVAFGHEPALAEPPGTSERPEGREVTP